MALFEIDEVFGLPAHPLLVHGAVVVIPLVALGAIAVAVVPWLRRRLAWLVALGALGCVAMVPLVTGAGRALEDRVPETDLVERHTELGETLLPWVAGPAWALVAGILAAVLTVPVAAGTLVQVVRIGHSGSAAVWSGTGEEGEEDGEEAEAPDEGEDGGSGRGRGRGRGGDGGGGPGSG